MLGPPILASTTAPSRTLVQLRNCQLPPLLGSSVQRTFTVPNITLAVLPPPPQHLLGPLALPPLLLARERGCLSSRRTDSIRRQPSLTLRQWALRPRRRLSILGHPIILQGTVSARCCSLWKTAERWWCQESFTPNDSFRVFMPDGTFLFSCPLQPGGYQIGRAHV